MAAEKVFWGGVEAWAGCALMAASSRGMVALTQGLTEGRVGFQCEIHGASVP